MRTIHTNNISCYPLLHARRVENVQELDFWKIIYNYLVKKKKKIKLKFFTYSMEK